MFLAITSPINLIQRPKPGFLSSKKTRFYKPPPGLAMAYTKDSYERGYFDAYISAHPDDLALVHTLTMILRDHGINVVHRDFTAEPRWSNDYTDWISANVKHVVILPKKVDPKKPSWSFDKITSFEQQDLTTLERDTWKKTPGSLVILLADNEHTPLATHCHKNKIPFEQITLFKKGSSELQEKALDSLISSLKR